MKKRNKKGFTIVELVIVIAVIAILAAVLIPTFSGIVEKANKSSALSTARNAYAVILSASKDGDISDKTANVIDAYIEVKVNESKTYWFQIESGSLSEWKASNNKTEPTVTQYSSWTHGDADVDGKLADLPTGVTVYVNSTAAGKITPTGTTTNGTQNGGGGNPSDNAQAGEDGDNAGQPENDNDQGNTPDDNENPQ